MYVPPLMCRRSAKQRQSRLRAISMRSPFARSDALNGMWCSRPPTQEADRDANGAKQSTSNGYAENTWAKR